MAIPSALHALGIRLHLTDIGLLLVVPKPVDPKTDDTTNQIIPNIIRIKDDPR